MRDVQLYICFVLPFCLLLKHDLPNSRKIDGKGRLRDDTREHGLKKVSIRLLMWVNKENRKNLA